MSIKLFAPLAVAGSGLVASNSMWFFVSNEEVKDKTPEQKIPTVPKQNPDEKEINWLPPVPKMTRTTTVLKDNSMEKGDYIVNSGVYTFTNNKSKKQYLSVVQTQMEDFILRFNSTRGNYKNFKKEEIKIKLFTKPAWYSTNFVDEYETEVDSSQIQDIFSLGDEVKIKQLLLSLHKRYHWKKTHETNDYITYWGELIIINNLEPLKDLKIKYFKDFSSLKGYIQEKIKLCDSDDKACIVNWEELDFMETDKPEYYIKPQE